MITEKEFLHDLSAPLTAVMLSLEAYKESLMEAKKSVDIELQQAVDKLITVTELVQLRKAQLFDR